MLLTQEERLMKTGLLMPSSDSEDDFRRKARVFIRKLKNVFMFDHSIGVYDLQYFPKTKTFFYKIEYPPGRNGEVTIKMLEIMSELDIKLRF